ncbi:hypothetical protein SAMN05421640_2351 [Ekhidna lutea]|uniref:Uncharacterized protein n=1 Tax=Ekhidna lutea TaxID=447679 RepID=A0A239K3F9_EKHLU|nr:hypothetical protein SAMN05421640_2351 [Ekhidna lutea]
MRKIFRERIIDVKLKIRTMNIFKFFAKREDKDRVRLTKSQTGDWMVKKGFSILYIGSKEKCETFMKQTLSV